MYLSTIFQTNTANLKNMFITFCLCIFYLEVKSTLNSITTVYKNWICQMFWKQQNWITQKLSHMPQSWKMLWKDWWHIRSPTRNQEANMELFGQYENDEANNRLSEELLISHVEILLITTLNLVVILPLCQYFRIL